MLLELGKLLCGFRGNEHQVCGCIMSCGMSCAVVQHIHGASECPTTLNGPQEPCQSLLHLLHSSLDAGIAASLRRVRMAQLNVILGQLLGNSMQLRFWRCVVLALTMRRLRQCGSTERAWVRTHAPVGTSQGQDLSLQCLWIHVQTNTVEERPASSLVWRVDGTPANLHQVQSG